MSKQGRYTRSNWTRRGIVNLKVAVFLCISSLTFHSSYLMAQGDIDDAEVTFIKERKIKLPPAEREFESLDYKKQEIKTNRKFKFESNDYQIPLGDVETKTNVLRTKKDKIKKLYSSYLNFGLGNYATSRIKYHYANRRSKTISYGLNVDHLSSLTGPVENSAMSDNDISLYAKRYFNGKQLGFKANYELNRFRYYGYNQDVISIANTDSITQAMNHIGATLNYKNKERDKLYYNVYGRFNFFAPSFLKEIKSGYTGSLRYKLDDSKSIELNSEFSTDQISSASATTNRNLFKAQAGFKYKMSNLELFGGVRLALNNDSLFVHTTNTHIYPIINAKYLVSENTSVGAELAGDLNRNNMESLLLENPYLDSTQSVFDDNKKIGIKLDVRSGVGSNLFVKAAMGYSIYENLHMYGTSLTDTTRFTTIWNTGNVGHGFVKVGVEHKLKDKLLTGVTLGYNNYQVDSLELATYRPGIEVQFFTKYNVQNKIELELNGTYWGNFNSYSLLREQKQELSDIIDLRVKFKYNMSPKVSLYFEANNLIAKKYQYYINYPKKGFNFIAGINYSF